MSINVLISVLHIVPYTDAAKRKAVDIISRNIQDIEIAVHFT